MTDLVDELLNNAQQNDILGKITQKGAFGVTKYELDVDGHLSRVLGKGEGHYTTIKVRQNFLWSSKIRRYIINILKQTITKFLSKYTSAAPEVLVVGLGNGNMVCDSLGNLVCRDLCVIDKSIAQQLGIGRLSYLMPGVSGVTGIDSFDLIEATIRKTTPCIVCIIDSLTATSIDRLGLTFQCSDAGIVPGNGVGNGRHRLCFETLGVPVVSVGVPLLIGIQDLCHGLDIEHSIYQHFTPKEIDFVIGRCAKIVGCAINESIYTKDILDIYK